MKINSIQRQGSTLAMAMLVIGALAMCVAAFFQTLIPKYRSVYQGASWQEALHGAEAGADFAIQSLNSWSLSTGDPDTYPWTANNWVVTDSAYSINGERILANSSLPYLGGDSAVRVTKLAVDVYTRDTSGSPPGLSPWFRIRSTARSNLPGRYSTADSRDSVLRRMKLGAKNGASDDPHVTRTVEVILRPRYRFVRAITTVNDMLLGNSSNWMVDSFDSGDTNKSDPGTAAGGLYPLNNPSEIQSNGDIASAKVNPTSNPYEPLIQGNGAIVRGDVQTTGGDNPNTATHENVSGSYNMDQSRITDDFEEELPPPIEPVWTSTTYQGNNPSSFVTGSQSSPTRYVIMGNLGSFNVTAPASDTGYIEILITGNLNTGTGGGAGITIPPNVFATIWVRGNIDFGNGAINTNSSSSRVATHLTVYGTGTIGTSTYRTSGNGTQALSFYGPNYNATLDGTVSTSGSFVVRDFTLAGGGNGGFHYDEALNRGGPVAGWEVASNFEDNRADL
jgi:hypothetical protein